MELRHLRYFVAVAEELNFRRAAARLHIAPPPLSVQVRKLEAEIGVQLLSREGRGIRLTEAGRAFLHHARETLAHAKRGVAVARQASSGEIGHLSIGYNAPAEFRVFPQIIPAFKRKWADVHLAFHRLETTQIVEALRRGELDLGFVCLPVPTGEFDVEELTQEPLVALLPADHRLASARSITVQSLSQEPLILFPRALDPEAYRQIEDLFLRAGAVMNVEYELDTSLSMINFVAMGIGCSFLPDYARRIHVDGVVYKPLRPRQMAKTLAIVKKKGKGELTEKFYRFALNSLWV